jgi:hypothetical protein
MTEYKATEGIEIGKSGTVSVIRVIRPFAKGQTNKAQFGDRTSWSYVLLAHYYETQGSLREKMAAIANGLFQKIGIFHYVHYTV